ncbi:hypothetical protein ACXZ9C_11075 [Streptococcus agalactiae]
MRVAWRGYHHRRVARGVVSYVACRRRRRVCVRSRRVVSVVVVAS